MTPKIPKSLLSQALKVVYFTRSGEKLRPFTPCITHFEETVILVGDRLSLMSVMNRSNGDGPFMPRKGSAVRILRNLRFYVAICSAASISLIGSALPQWTEPASWRILLTTTLVAPLFPWVAAEEALSFLLILISDPPLAVLTSSLFGVSAFLMRDKNIGWWLIILALIPCTTIAAFALHAVGWVPKPSAAF